MQLCFPEEEEVDFVDEIIDVLLNHHSEYHDALRLPHYTPYQKFGVVEI